MLDHVVEAEILDLILGGMDMVVAILESTLNNECTWITGLGGAGMVGTCITTESLHIRNVAVLSDDLREWR